MLEPLAERLSKVSIILASGSPRRREILSTALPKLQLQKENCFHVVTSDAEEKFGLNKNDAKYAGENVWKYAVDTARLKAEDVFNRATQNTIPNLNETFMVIGSDTIVTYGGTIYGKPKDKEDAIRVLKELSGKTHSVISGVVILLNHTKHGTIQNKIEHQFHSVTKVQFDDLDDNIIKAYVETGEPMDKAGGYGIQALGGTLIKRIDGDYYNVVGFPLNLFCKTITNIYQ